MFEELRKLLGHNALRAVFQPIVDGATRRPYGYEALIRGPDHSPLHFPAALWATAAQHDFCVELDLHCITCALRDFTALGAPTRLFVNVRPQTLLEQPNFTSWLRKACARFRMDPHDIVIELTEHGAIGEDLIFSSTIAQLREIGCDIAIDDLGAGSSGLKTWSAIRPDFVKVDRYFVSAVEHDPVRAEILRLVVEMGRATGSRIIAEGVENREQCLLVLELGVDHVQGYLLGRPRPDLHMDPQAFQGVDLASTNAGAECAEDLAQPVQPVPATMAIADVVERFRQEPECSALAVVQDQRPVGLIRRDELLILLSKPLHPEIYNRKPVISVVDRHAIQIEARARLEQVSRLVTARAHSRQREEFIITRGGIYLGIGKTLDLLRQITVQQIQTAKHSNPLTGLPGNHAIQQCLSRWLTHRRSFVACHLDLDHFKAFNDTYGYAKGDQVLLHVASVVSLNLRARVDFVGHVGGDDFIFLVRSQDGLLRLAAVLEELAASLANFHTPEHRALGGMQALDRDGSSRCFPLLSVSIAAVQIENAGKLSAEQVGEELRRVKAAAKAITGHSCLLSNGGELTNLFTAAGKAIEPVRPSLRRQAAQA